jgi:hypothetical protein
MVAVAVGDGERLPPAESVYDDAPVDARRSYSGSSEDGKRWWPPAAAAPSASCALGRGLW